MARNAALYLKSVGAGAMITAPMMSAAFMLREPLVDIILGPSWATLADVLAWLAPVGFLQSISSSTGTVFMACGKTSTLMRLGVCSAATVVVAFMLRVPYGVVGVAASYFLANLLLAPISLMLAMRQLGGGLLPILKCLGGPAACSAIMCAALWILRATTPVLSTGIAGFAATCLIGATVYLLAQGCFFWQRLGIFMTLIRPA